jgi:hypothetical protein
MVSKTLGARPRLVCPPQERVHQEVDEGPIRAKAFKVAKASKKPAPANTMAVRASTMKATGLLPNQVSFLLGFSAH